MGAQTLPQGAAWPDLFRAAGRVARKYRGHGLPHEDLVGEALAGMLGRIPDWNPRKARFMTYMGVCAEGAIRHALRDRVRLIKLPAYVQEHATKINRFGREWEQTHGRPASPEELAEGVDLPVERVRKVEAAVARTHRVASLEECIPEQAPAVRGYVVKLLALEKLETEPDDDPTTKLYLQHLISRLKPLERALLLGSVQYGLTLREMAVGFDFSLNYISYIIRGAIARMREMHCQSERRAEETLNTPERRSVCLPAYGRRSCLVCGCVEIRKASRWCTEREEWVPQDMGRKCDAFQPASDEIDPSRQQKVAMG